MPDEAIFVRKPGRSSESPAGRPARQDHSGRSFVQAVPRAAHRRCDDGHERTTQRGRGGAGVRSGRGDDRQGADSAGPDG
jgi:hypothetical protein